MTLALRYDSLDIGSIDDAFCGEEATRTWFGKFSASLRNGQDVSEKRIHDFISYCQKWHQRLEVGEAPNASEFNEFKDIVDSDSWSIGQPGGTAIDIRCPVFYGDEITWTIEDET